MNISLSKEKHSNLSEYLNEGNTPLYWTVLFEDEKKELETISEKIEEEKDPVYPEICNIFRIYYLLKPEEIRVVILGQDPYHTPGLAMGIAFSVPEGNKAPSLRNIMGVLKKSGYKTEGTDLTQWAKQGVFLFNTALSVRKGTPKSHSGWWRKFAEATLKYIVKNKGKLIFALWGNDAQETVRKAGIKRSENVYMIESSHPSGFSANSGDKPFMKSDVFNRINDKLREWKKEEIDWNLLKGYKEDR